MKHVYKYILTLVAILMVTSNAWAATETWNGGVAVGAGKGSATVELYNDGLISDTKEETATSTNSTVASFSKTETTSIFNLSIDKRYMKFTATKADGYEFTGWFSNAACTQSYSTDNPYQTSSNNKSLDLTLYAKFTPHTYTVNYNGNGATSGSMNSHTLVFDQTEKLNANQYKRIYTITYINDDATSTNTATATYTGWSTNEDGTGTSYTDQADMRDFLLSHNDGTLNLYAKWTLANITLPSPTKEGYILEGWYDSNGKVGNAGDEITPTSDMTLTAYWIQKFTPNLQGPSEITMQVADTTLVDFIFENVSQDKPSENSGDFHFTITHSPDNTSKEGSPNRNVVISYDPSTNNIIALNSGTATITFIQEEIDTYYTDTLRSTITVSKQTSSFTLNFANEYYVDDEINDSTFLTNATNSEVAIQVSDKTTDNRALFTYNGSVLKANGAPINADSETTTITVTQPENYKWTSYTQEQTVTVKKHQTNFSWNDGESLECYVDDQTDITNLYTKASDNTLPVNFNVEVVERGYGNTDVVTLENGVLKAIGEGKVVVTASQAVDRKWTDFSTPITINVKRYDVSATLNPTTTVWNATHSNPFSVSISPANGETITDFIVGESSNSAIATYNASSKTIQTYYTSGSADFQITRPEDRKYNALNQTLTLTVKASTASCDIFTDPIERNFSTGVTDFTGHAGYAYEIPENVRAYADSVYITAKRNGSNYFFLQYSTNGGSQWTDFPEGELNLSTSYQTFGLKIPEGKTVTHIRPYAKTGATQRKDYKDFRVTRKTDLSTTPEFKDNATLVLPPVAINQSSSNTFTLNWSTCSDISISCDNSKFTVSDKNGTRINSITTDEGQQEFVVSCNTSELGTFEGTITIYNQAEKVTIPVSCTVNPRWIPEFTGSTTYSKLVDDTWVADFTFKNTETAKPSAETSAPFYFTIDHQSFVNTDRSTRNPEHLDEVISYDPETYKITAHNAGTAILTFTQKDTPGYFPGSYSCTITVAKNETNFELNLADLYLVDAEVPTANILKNKSNNEVDIQVSDITTNDRHLFTYDGTKLKANGDQLQADSETTTITVSQPETYKWTGKTLTKDVTVKKYDSQFSFTKEGADYVCKIDDIISESDFYSLATDHEIPAIINVEILETANEDHPEVLIFNEENRHWEAKSAGKAKVTISQPENRKWTAYTGTRIVEIQKHTPIFTWNDPVYFNRTISDYFTTNNNPNDSEYATDIVISQESTDPDVAIIYFNQEDETDKHTLNLTTYYKETTPASSTTVTVSQAENWYWYAKEDTHTITPQNRNNHISNTPITETNLNDFKIEYQDPWNNPWTSDGIHFGQGGIGSGDGGYNWNDKYIIIEFTGVPDELSFITTATQPVLGMGGSTTGNNSNLFFYVSEGTSATNWTKTWEYTERDNDIKVKLNPNTRFLKLCFTGNLEGWFKNVRITELNQFDAVPNSLDFGTVSVTDNTSKSLTFNIAYANAGYKVNIELDREAGRTWADEEAYNLAKQYIEITPEFIGTIGGEKSGTSEAITVRLHSDDQSGYTIPDDARIKIYDEVGHTTYVSLKGLIEKSTQSITWNAYFSLTEPIQIPLSTDWVSKAAEASSNLPVKYKSSDTEVIEVSDDGSKFKPKNEGNATITAYQEGNSQYGYVESTKNVKVTKKNIQLIGWTDDLSDIIFEENTPDITLNAGVYIIDVVNNTFEYSADQTAKLVYTVGEGGSSVVTVEGNTLHIIGLGETTLTATIEADEFHEGTTMTIPVVVREPAIGCEDILLLDHTAQIEFFQMNTNQITKDAIALDRTKGIPGYLLFQHKGERWASIFYTGSIKAQQSTDGGSNWTDVPGSTITPTIGSFITTDSLPLDQNATHIRFVRPSGGQGHHFVKDIKVAPAQYLKANTTSIDFESINMGGTYTKTFTLSYSNIKSPLIATTSSKDVTVNLNRLGECGQFGEKEITVTWKPNNNKNQSVTFQDTLANLSVTVNLMANIQLRKQKIVWENPPTVIWDYTDIDNRPTHTRDVNNNELIDLPITYKVTEGTDCAYFEDNMFFIINEGSITIQASNPGNEEYLAVDSTYQITIQGIPPTFIGGAENDLWSTKANWVNEAKPDETQTASITAPVTINEEEINVNKVRVASAGSIHITSTGGLTVGEGGVQCVTTDGSAIIIDNLHSGAGFFRISPDCEDELPRITMRYQTQSTLDNGANKDATWQYIGAPGNNATVYVDYNTWLYKHEEASADWVVEKRMDSVALGAFHGYSITQYGQPTYEWTADFTNANCTIPLTYSKNGRSGRHIIANSYTAPINVAAFNGDEFTYLEGMSDKYRIEKTLYLYNSGSWNQWHEQDSLGTGTNTDGTNTPGQYYAIPVLAAGENYLDGLQTTITPMQGIYLRVRSKTPLDELPEAGEQVGNLILNYERLVMGSDHEMHRPMRAPQRTTSSAMQDPNFRRVRIVATSENSGADRVYIIQDNINTRKYNNGYDAPNQETKGLVNIYTNESGGKMEVSCSNNIDSMYIGFMAGEDQTYTLHFGSIIGNIFYLDDLTTGETINIVEGGTYTFNAEPQSTNDKRFLLRMPRVSSNADALNNAKIWSVDKILYVDNAILPSPLTIYDVSGHHILSDIVDSPQFSIDLSHLLEGVYLVRVNNQVYKFISK